MTREEVYRHAWKLFMERIAMKTSWGKNELATAAAVCLETALDAVGSS